MTNTVLPTLDDGWINCTLNCKKKAYPFNCFRFDMKLLTYKNLLTHLFVFCFFCLLGIIIKSTLQRFHKPLFLGGSLIQLQLRLPNPHRYLMSHSCDCILSKNDPVWLINLFSNCPVPRKAQVTRN